MGTFKDMFGLCLLLNAQYISIVFPFLHDYCLEKNHLYLGIESLS